ncbi:hypothetical protein VD0002_g345 [Verticillium dahliae]|uniref:dolichol kinase n=1 Tax=Verticillium dahliae TaxID=27337 RepID=A0AA44WRF8_VERDA|nr:dolichol kinase [Verticillium dahliae]PNH35559.1 hypothetical protein BJF96_g1325 [Verticillium dahliae]PNH57633.1 hypothetical protein VD0003_g284 [Verticillium dahliae]PNH70192.1 hypothetical protein VD0002_g345 [Verticillium dahliae]
MPPDRLKPESLAPRDDANDIDELRSLNRTPHPYHHLSAELPHAAHRFAFPATSAAGPTSAPSPARSDDSSEPSSPFPSFTKESTPLSDSGTEADDEHFLKGLPAPRIPSHKGLRGRNELISGTSSPLLSPAYFGDRSSHGKLGEGQEKPEKELNFWEDRNYRRTKELIRRTLEFIISGVLFGILWTNDTVRPILREWNQELSLIVALSASLMLLYPVRLVSWAYRNRNPPTWPPFSIPTIFDPASILYPPCITMLVSILVAMDNRGVVLPNIILSISAMPKFLIPTAQPLEVTSTFHWALSCIPLAIARAQPKDLVATLRPDRPTIDPETAVLLYPLHQSLLVVLHHMTTTSLLTAELQLLSIGLINVLLLAHSPQATILQSLLWVGGVTVLTLCGPVIRWGIALARVPRLRFRRTSFSPGGSWFGLVKNALLPQRARRDFLRSPAEESASEVFDSDEDTANGPLMKPSRVRTFTASDLNSHQTGSLGRSTSASVPSPSASGFAFGRTSTMPVVNRPQRSMTHTHSGRRKRTSSTTVRSFFRLTETQATVKRWIYSAYVHVGIVLIILLPTRDHIGRYALNGHEAIGWALGYLFGDLPWFRFQVVSNDLERWIFIPPRLDDIHESCHLGWVQHIRHADFGEANTRLLIGVYWLIVIAFGLIVVVNLDPKFEVDTRRKVFHFMMVAMILPTTYVDPVFVGLALSFALAIFLVVDLLRASQLPPLSCPIASFLTPYVDGRDNKGPVVISHIFLLIGCAIPLWLALATLPRSSSAKLEDDPLAGWEVPTREVSMVAGVICVGLGDAAASLIGRRYGHKKWIWGGGKSLEGSVAFAAAVFVGLMSATTWLRVGGWPVAAKQQTTWAVATRNAGVCGTMASLTEAVLTGGNDNVIVPIVLWTCVKSLGV